MSGILDSSGVCRFAQTANLVFILGFAAKSILFTLSGRQTDSEGRDGVGIWSHVGSVANSQLFLATLLVLVACVVKVLMLVCHEQDTWRESKTRRL